MHINNLYEVRLCICDLPHICMLAVTQKKTQHITTNTQRTHTTIHVKENVISSTNNGHHERKKNLENRFKKK